MQQRRKIFEGTGHLERVKRTQKKQKFVETNCGFQNFASSILFTLAKDLDILIGF